MTTVAEIVAAAGRKIGVIDMTTDEKSDAVEALNLMLQQWSAIPSIKNAVTRETFNLTSGTASYAVGSGATIDTTWPSKIKSAFIRDNDTDYPLHVFSAEEYAYIGEKSESTRPVVLYHERTYPSGTFFFWPTPDSSYTVHLWSHKNFSTYTISSTSLALPLEYEPAVVYNLAIELAPEFGREPSQAVVARAAMTVKTLKNINVHPVPQINTDVICKQTGSSGDLFNMNFDGLGYITLPFVLRG